MNSSSSTFKSETIGLSQKKVERLLRVGKESLPQIKKFKYLRVLFTTEERTQWQVNRRIDGNADSSKICLGEEVASQTAKLLIYRPIVISTLTYGHELLIVT